MNSRPPTGEAIADESGRVGRGWSNWLEQVFLGLMGWKKSFNYTFTIDFGSVSANSQSASSAKTIIGVRPGDAVMVTPTADTSGIIFSGVVTANDQITFYAKNFTVGAINPPSTELRVIVIQN